jgi:hypothetical protein
MYFLSAAGRYFTALYLLSRRTMFASMVLSEKGMSLRAKPAMTVLDVIPR